MPDALMWLVIGIVVGVALAAAAGVSMVRSKMVVPEQSARSFDDTCAAIEREVGATDGWSFPMASFDMSAKLIEKEALPDNVKRIQLFFVCSPKIARRVLGARPQFSAIMPCTWSVYELIDGSVWVSKMNIAMMSRIMGGVVGESMGAVAEADKRFMAKVLSADS
jgi:uncharacterized protein (DUF302 family)